MDGVGEHGLRPQSSQPRLRLEILGPVAAWRDEVPVALGSIRQRAVLALLAMHAEAGLSRAAIIDALWGDDPPETAVTMVQGYITRIRRLLGAGDGPPARGSVLWWDEALYRLAPGAVDTDLAEFTQLAGRPAGRRRGSAARVPAVRTGRAAMAGRPGGRHRAAARAPGRDRA